MSKASDLESIRRNLQIKYGVSDAPEPLTDYLDVSDAMWCMHMVMCVGVVWVMCVGVVWVMCLCGSVSTHAHVSLPLVSMQSGAVGGKG